MSLSLSFPVSVPISVSLSLDACTLCIVRVWGVCVCRSVVCVCAGLWCVCVYVCVVHAPMGMCMHVEAIAGCRVPSSIPL